MKAERCTLRVILIAKLLRKPIFVVRRDMHFLIHGLLLVLVPHTPSRPSHPALRSPQALVVARPVDDQALCRELEGTLHGRGIPPLVVGDEAALDLLLESGTSKWDVSSVFELVPAPGSLALREASAHASVDHYCWV